MVTQLAVALLFSAQNSPEEALERTKDKVLLKLNLRCGTTLTVTYDGDSLRQHNQDIRYDTTGGDRECNEPLRYLWALCSTEEGKAVVRRSEVREVVCRGTPNAVGSLTFKAGVITVERAFEESKYFVRAHKQFEAAFKRKVKVDEDPYYDEAWDLFRREKNPVLSTTDYCLVDGKKTEFDWSAADQNDVLNQGLSVKCFEAGKVVIDVTVKDRKQTGLMTQTRDAWRRVGRVVADQREGLEETSDGGKLLSQAMYKEGHRVWEKEFHPSGSLKRYWRQYPTPVQLSVSLGEDGKVYGLNCGVEAKDDEVLRSWCGFAGEKTVDVYDGTKKINATVTYLNGVKTKQVAGNSAYASGSTMNFVEGKPDGEERINRRDGTLESTITWKRGVKSGREKKYSDDGKKVVVESTWRDGELERRVEFFLNGNKKSEDVRDGAKVRRVTEYFDLGGVRSEGGYVPCERRYGNDGWCEDGTHTSFFEGGKKAGEETFKLGQRLTSKRWYPTGVLAETETYVERRLTARTSYFADGGVEADEAYEADGSRKVKPR